MAARSFNYSKWDKIELSDDESDLHPNIDKDSWFRLKHRTRIEREEKEDQEVKEYQQKTAEDNTRLKIIRARISNIESGKAGDDAEFEDVDALKIEANELQHNIDMRNARIAEINEKRKWNIDNICVTKEEKTVVSGGTTVSLKADNPIVDPIPFTSASPEDSKEEHVFTKSSTTENAATNAKKDVTVKAASTPKSTVAPAANSNKPKEVPRGAEPSATIQREKLAVMSYNDYVIGHEKVLEDFSEIADLESSKKFLFDHCDVLLHEHAQSYMLLSCLEDEMNGKKKRMKLVCRQSQILSHIHELGVSMKRDPRDVILPFFRRIEEKEYLTGFLSAVDDFIKRIQKRAVEKRKEMDAERGDEEEHPLGPGGLDPYEVLESLPTILREAFESQDLQRLQDVLGGMDATEAKYHMKRCVDSGLWVPNNSAVYEEDDEEGEEDKGEAAAGRKAPGEIAEGNRVEEL